MSEKFYTVIQAITFVIGWMATPIVAAYVHNYVGGVEAFVTLLVGCGSFIYLSGKAEDAATRAHRREAGMRPL